MGALAHGKRLPLRLIFDGERAGELAALEELLRAPLQDVHRVHEDKLDATCTDRKAREAVAELYREDFDDFGYEPLGGADEPDAVLARVSYGDVHDDLYLCPREAACAAARVLEVRERMAPV